MVEIRYARRPHQQALHDAMRQHRRALLVWHRRAGKTMACVHQLLRACLTCERDAPRFAYIAPLYRQAKDVAWDYLRRFSSQIPDVKIRESELRVDYPNGGRIQLYGSDNPDSLRGIYLDGVVYDEFGQIHPRLRPEIVIPALSDRAGWEIVCGTPQGANQFYALYQQAKDDAEWYCQVLRASESGAVDPGELETARRNMSEEQYAREYECSWQAAIPGAYYGRLMERALVEGRICSVPYDAAAAVWTAWDLGVGDATAIWFAQLVGRELHLVDYLESSGQGLSYYAGQVLSRGWAYGGHILPHDAEARELGTGRTRVEVLRSHGIVPKVLPLERVEDGIEAARTVLPRCWFDEKRCATGIEALRNYREAVNERTGHSTGHPLHDWASHGADAFRYLAMGMPQRDVRLVRDTRPRMARM